MKTKTKIAVDRLVGLPLAWLLNGLARILGKLLRRDHSIEIGNVRTIVISKYVGMGSILQATPLIRTLRLAFPDAELIFLTGVSCRRLVERLEHVDRIITVDDRSLFRLRADELANCRAVDASEGRSFLRPGGVLGLCEHRRSLEPGPEPDRILSPIRPAQAGQLHAPDVLQPEESHPVYLRPTRPPDRVRAGRSGPPGDDPRRRRESARVHRQAGVGGRRRAPLHRRQRQRLGPPGRAEMAGGPLRRADRQTAGLV